MKEVYIKDLMVPLSDYATISQDATLHCAMLALEEALKAPTPSHHPHRAVLVLDETGHTVGKLSHFDLIRAFEPRYNEIEDSPTVKRLGFSASFIQSTMEDQGLWQQPLDDLCVKADQILVKDIMYTPAEGEYVEEDATLNTGIHQLIIGRHQSLLVTRDSKVVGVLRLTDVFSEIGKLIKAARP